MVFRTDIADLIRSYQVELAQRNLNENLQSVFRLSLESMLDELQLVVDKKHFGSEIHLVLGKKMRELVVTPSFCSGADRVIYLASFSLQPDQLRRYIYDYFDHPICFESKSFDETFRAELSCQAEALVDRLIEEKAKSLNQRHRTNFSVSYWRVLIGPWVHQFVHQIILFDRMLKSCIDHIGSKDVWVQTLAPAQWPQFHTTLDAVTAAKHDLYIQVLFSFIIKSRYRDKLLHRDVSVDLNRNNRSTNKRGSFNCFVREVISKFFFFISSKVRSDLLLASEVPERKATDLKLWWDSNFRWVPDFVTDQSYSNFKNIPPVLSMKT